jgi:uncharacterized surface protein with fasciclin (FAS1) repeats
MKSLNHVTLVKRAAGLAGMLAATVAIALPVAAQTKPEAAPVAPETEAAPMAPEAAPMAPEAEAAPMTPETAPMAPEAEAAPTAPNAQTPAPSTPIAATTGTIVDIASASDSFETLVAALTEAELAEVLQGEGPFTVFAPTDEAFAALPAGTVEELLKPENRAMLVQVLKYHVVSGAYPASSLSSGEVPTVEGSTVTVTVSDGQVTVNDATVIQPDITATNGVIHAIDRVILPPQ